MGYVIRIRKRIEVNTDPKRRCYHGCHAESELRWTAWENLETMRFLSKTPNTLEGAQERIKFWRELNDYAISQRGESARCEFDIVEDNEEST